MATMTFLPRRYTTTFPGTENPISEGGVWVQGAVTAGNFQNTRCTPGYAIGAGPSSSPPYDDPTSVLSGVWGAVQTAEGTVRVDAIENGVNQEVELRLLTTITAGFIKGYEILFSITTNAYVELMRWEGTSTAIDQFHSIAFLGNGTSPQLQTGYRVKATISSAGVITAFVDSGGGYVQMLQGTDTTYRDGAPGIGFFKHAGSSGALSGAGFTSFTCVGAAR